ncbi:Xaa-Pro dipeptidase [Cohnella sp. OV330]|uniref:M24 family metallopeptidase n=1 Tax=Cohnella sp. OV330 TaxID=1855288 RepID=UPI0008E66B84|nr:Xaa-Pro peptidase family protein [Cohnella sp. OV330]SFA90318.1 Xaa-Pro dipeptidase [Cohnella sp. OV330]
MPSEVYKERRGRLISYMEKEGIRIGLVTSPTNVAYLTGFACNPHERFLALALDSSNRATKLFVPLLDATAAKEAAPGLAIVPISDVDDAYALLGGQMPATGVASIGVEKGTVSLAKAELLQAVYPGVVFADLEQAILDMRIVKSADEIGRIQRAVDIVEAVMAHAVSQVRVGMTELALAAEIERKMRELGADRPAFETIVLTGARSALPHGVPGQHAIRRGDFLLIDIGVQAGGYCSDITRTFVVGEVSEAQRAIYEAVLAANEAGIAASAAGVAVSAVDAAARKTIEQAGFGSLFTHRVGHGFGMDIHEQPSMSGANGTLMAPGMVFTVEPGVYDSVAGGVRIEDDVYIQDNGTAGVLTRYPKQLTVIAAEDL